MSQAFCSALPVTYSAIPSERSKSFAVRVLEGAYEARRGLPLSTLAIGLQRAVSDPAGRSAFGNEPQWIHDAMRRALTKVVDVSLDVRVVSYRKPDPALAGLVAEFA